MWLYLKKKSRNFIKYIYLIEKKLVLLMENLKNLILLKKNTIFFFIEKVVYFFNVKHFPK